MFLKENEMMKYHEQLKHPLWQRKRLEVMQYHGFVCQECGAKDQELNVHHPFYRRGAMIWDYGFGELQCLCSKCHKYAHTLDEKIKFGLSILSHSDKQTILGLIESYYLEEADISNDYSDSNSYFTGRRYRVDGQEEGYQP